jgi:acyl-CoA thioester hydrolase
VTDQPVDPQQLRLADFPVQRTLPLRWADIDMYGHLNNSVHYQLMDTAINGWIADATGSHPRDLPATGLVVETSCRYLAEIGPGDVPVLGIRLEKAGTSSIRYEVGFFTGDTGPAAIARFVHVYVDPTTRRPVPIPDVVRDALARELGA